ncbi:purine phosphoribosyltransferase family protein Apf [Temnothorax americanus]|uniref:Bis(5'-nucleosyl)-tetraphosphatase [asymmetrical] n=2 Tax=Temnothorax TaxID=300110 RepID=A0A6J1QRX0_9HYME|nr:bis(5'-nucleosyl)-tetraphosphatase [asymmetrical] [Temnothorax curvispinosus]TGZ54261.1 Bis(5'-nucleosyl)-tetraphosphatase [Temnothorax longispinosus]
MTLQQRACGLVIFRRFQGTIQYLLMQTSYGDHHWTPPKGHVDPDESDMETALRETREEAGFVPNDLKIFEDARHEMTYEVKGRPKIVIYWLAELLNPDKPVRLSDEHQAFDWLPLREACDRARYDEMRKALNEFDKYVSRNLA